MKSAVKIKQSILAKAQVICLGVDFSEIRLDKHVVNRRIKVIPKDANDKNNGADSESNPANPKHDP